MYRPAPLRRDGLPRTPLTPTISQGNPLEPLRVEVAGETNVGKKRNHNEDNFAIFSEYGLYIVADGMGGHASGEVASKMAVDTLREFFAATVRRSRADVALQDGPRPRATKRTGSSPGSSSPTCASSRPRSATRGSAAWARRIVAIFAVDDGVYVAHVGDSRVYRVRDGKLEQLTEDHSLLNDYIKMKRLTAEEIANFPHKNVIVRALGMKDTVKVDTRFEAPRARRHRTCSAPTGSRAP